MLSVPPDILWDETSSDVSVTEGNSVSLDCRATGYPKPNITWRREDGDPIILKNGARDKIKVELMHLTTMDDLKWFSGFLWMNNNEYLKGGHFMLHMNKRKQET
uniref:Ig-like domain-containing protein n=1 Tax=Strigamia maritima TaxID=126957 RepID=T1JKF9_STRMM